MKRNEEIEKTIAAQTHGTSKDQVLITYFFAIWYISEEVRREKRKEKKIEHYKTKRSKSKQNKATRDTKKSNKTIQNIT